MCFHYVKLVPVNMLPFLPFTLLVCSLFKPQQQSDSQNNQQFLKYVYQRFIKTNTFKELQHTFWEEGLKHL